MISNLLPLLSFLLLILLWYGLAVYINDNTLPSPIHVLKVFWQEVKSGQLPYHLGVTLLRLVASFFIATGFTP